MSLLLYLLAFQRKRTSTGLIIYALFMYFLGLISRSISKALDPFVEKRSHVAIWNWVQLFHPTKFYLKRTRVTAFIIDETMLQIGSDCAWLWVAIEPVHKQVLGVYVSRHRNMLVAEQFIQSLIRKYGKHNISTDGGGTWYPQARRFLNIEHHIHSSIEKSFIERTIQYIKDRTECFDNYFPCARFNCKLAHVMKWLILFVDMYNRAIIVRQKFAK